MSCEARFPGADNEDSGHSHRSKFQVSEAPAGLDHSVEKLLVNANGGGEVPRSIK